jgi:hypothetical protein
MTSRLQFRNIDADPADPVETWPHEAIRAAIERGSISDWRRLAEAVQAAPWGPVARAIEQVLADTDVYGVGPLLRDVIGRARVAAQRAARAEVAARLGAAIARSGLTRAQFAARLGTSPSRLSTYLAGRVDPSASLLIRAEALSR